MDYNHINSFLDKFKNLISKGNERNRIILEVIFRNVGFAIDKKDIVIQGQVINLKISPIQKGEILMKKRIIMDDLRKLLPECYFSDIR